MGHVDRDVGIQHYNPKGFSNRNLQRRVNAVKIDISLVRRPFTEAAPAGAASVAKHLRVVEA